MIKQKSFQLVFLLLIILCVSCSKKEYSYFPLNKGYKWQYDVILITKDGLLNQKYILNNIGKNELDGKPVYLRESLDGTVLYYSITDEGIYYLGNDNNRTVEEKFNEDIQLVIPEKISVGSVWEQTTVTKLLKKTGPPQKTVLKIIADVPLEVKVESMNETVSVLAGRFDRCMKVTMSGFAFKDAGNYIGLTMVSVEQTNWYAPGVGLIKMERVETTARKALDKGSLTLELASYESA